MHSDTFQFQFASEVNAIQRNSYNVLGFGVPTVCLSFIIFNSVEFGNFCSSSMLLSFSKLSSYLGQEKVTLKTKSGRNLQESNNWNTCPPKHHQVISQNKLHNPPPHSTHQTNVRSLDIYNLTDINMRNTPPHSIQQTNICSQDISPYRCKLI